MYLCICRSLFAYLLLLDTNILLRIQRCVLCSTLWKSCGCHLGWSWPEGNTKKTDEKVFHPCLHMQIATFQTTFLPESMNVRTCTSEDQCSEIHWDTIISVVDRDKIYQYKTAGALLQKRMGLFTNDIFYPSLPLFTWANSSPSMSLWVTI